MSEEIPEDVVGIFTDITTIPPTAMWVGRSQREEIIGPLVMSHDMIDDMIGQIDAQQLEKDILASLGMGDSPELADRTLEAISEKLHALIDDIETPSPQDG